MNTQINAPASVKALLAKIGSQLKAAREEQNLSREDVCRALKMHINFVIALEEGLFEDLPGAASFFASLRTYARFLGLDSEKIIQECKKNQFLFQALQGEGIIQRPNEEIIIENKTAMPSKLAKLPLDSSKELFSQEENLASTTEKPKRNSKIPFILIALILTSVLGALAYFGFQNFSNIFSGGICKPFKLIAKETIDVKIIGLSINQSILERTLQPGEEIGFSDSQGIKIQISSPEGAALTYGRKLMDWSNLKQTDNSYVFECK